ncbi:17738_t:CDS:2 [Gigaspora margarita]|uniref:17738_t:CDS:1 n=1 Tax=Gigaspora margarita TaxID=4874 RepID=A0ABM8W5J8_GIGMA|nr:17738_t:CDS:2 [Gigaspora margarita]
MVSQLEVALYYSCSEAYYYCQSCNFYFSGQILLWVKVYYNLSWSSFTVDQASYIQDFTVGLY